MAQHDYVLSDNTGALFRADLNAALAAAATNNSGASEPATTYAYQPWADISAGKLKIRNGANDAWVVIGDLDQVNLGLIPESAIGTLVAAAGHSHAGMLVSDDIGNTVQAHMASASQAEMEAGTESALRSMSPLLVAQAIAAQSSSGGLTSIVTQLHGGAAGTFTVTIASPAVFTKSTHRFENGQTVRLTTTGALPTGLSTGTTYFVRDVAASTFRLAATKGGTAINTSGTQSGTHTVTPVFDKAINNPVGVIAEALGSGGSPSLSPLASGGEGGYALKWIPSASLGATETITTSTAGTSSFGSHLSATSGGTAGAGGAGGSGTGGDINITGKSGHSGGADYVAPTPSILGGTYGMGGSLTVTPGPGIVKVTEYI